MDREQLPCNRAQRSRAERAARDLKNTAAFGSTKNLMHEGTVMFSNCMFPQLDEFCRLIHERGIEAAPDFFTVDGGDGGTGAAPLPLMDEMGLPLRESLPMVVNKLHEYGLRPRIRVIASGKRVTPSEVAWALCAGADAVNSARGFMFALGRVRAMKCNRNTCPTGVTTHDKRLQRGLDPAGKAVRVANYAKNMVKEVSIIAHSCGVPEPRRLQRHHARVVSANGPSSGLDELHPPVATRPEYAR